MDDGQEQDHYEERLKDLFHSFDSDGVGSLCREELSALCQSLQLDSAAPNLFQTLLGDDDSATARVDFSQFKNALILILSSTLEPQHAEPEAEADSPVIQPKFVKGSKRYGRRSTPEFIDPFSASTEVDTADPTQWEEEEDAEDNDDSAVPRKRERWNSGGASVEEFEAEGQMQVWNPDEPSTPRGSSNPLSPCLEERLREACSELGIVWDSCVGQSELLALCQHLGLELSADLQQSLRTDGVMSVQEFVSWAVRHHKPPTPSASTPYRQLKRHHSLQPFDEEGRRTAAPALLTSTIGTCLFSTLDDGTGFTPAEEVIDAWLEEGIENGSEILEALNFSLVDKVSLCDLAVALENELLTTKNGIHQAALASFKAEIRHLLDCVDRESREKEKIHLDLEKAEKLKNQLAAEVDEHHSAIEHKNNLNLRKLEQEHKERLAAVRSELMGEMDQLQQQASRQREELEAEVQKIREDESFLRDHLSISVKENRRLEMELLDSTEQLMEAQSQVSKLQASVDNIMKERFGDLDPASADFFLQEERIKQLRAGYEAQYRELQDRIDELQAELRDFHSLGRVHQPCNNSLSEELESKSPGMESDPGIGSEEVQPFSMSLEAEMMLEQLKERHLSETEVLQNQLESKISEFDRTLEEQRTALDEQKTAMTLQHQQELRALREDMAGVELRAQELQRQLQQAELERSRVEQTLAEEKEGLGNSREEEVGSLKQQLLEAHTFSADLEEQLRNAEAQLTERDGSLLVQIEALQQRHGAEMKELEERLKESFQSRLGEETNKMQEEKKEVEKRLLEQCDKEKKLLQQSQQQELEAQLEEARLKSEAEREEIVRELTEQLQKEKLRLDEQHSESLQVLLEEELLRMAREQEEKQGELQHQWESERVHLLQQQEEAFLQRLLEDRRQQQAQLEQQEKKLREVWEAEKLQLEEDYEAMLEERLSEEKEKRDQEEEEEEAAEEKRLRDLLAEERARLEESHLEVVKEITARHSEERSALSSSLDKLRVEITQERMEVELSFQQRMKTVEEQFSVSQESVEKRFQADVLRLEQDYQSEVKALSESHAEMRLGLEAQLQEALGNAEKERRLTEETIALERERLDQRREEDRHELESRYKERVKDLATINQQLQQEVDALIGEAQTKEIELSRQLNDLHGRLQETLESRDELLTQTERRVLESELLIRERVEQERDDLKVKVEELDSLLRQAALDFELERKELQEELTILENRLQYVLERNGQGLVPGNTIRNSFEESVDQVLSPVEEANMLDEEENRIDDLAKVQDVRDDIYEDRKSGGGDVTEPAAREEERQVLTHIPKEEDLVPEGHQDVGGDTETHCCSQEIFSTASHEDFDPDGSVLSGSCCGVCALGESSATQRLCENDGEDKHSEDEDVDLGGENGEAPEPCGQQIKPQDVPALEDNGAPPEDERSHETAVCTREPWESRDPAEMFLVDFEVLCLSHNSHEPRRDAEPPTAAVAEDELKHDGVKPPDRGTDCEGGGRPLVALQLLYNTASGENVLLRQKASLLQQKTEVLESLLAHSGNKVQASRLALEENHGLKVQVLLLLEHVKELELKALGMTQLQVRYEDCMLENTQLRRQNRQLERRIWGVEDRPRVSHHLQKPLKVDENAGIRDDGTALDGEDQLLAEVPPVVDLQGCCGQLERQNWGLRRALTELRDQSQALDQSTLAQRTRASRLAEENSALVQKLAAFKDEDLKETQEEMRQTLKQLSEEKTTAQKEVESCNKQIFELCLHSRQLEEEKRKLSDKDAQNLSELENLRQQLTELMKETQRRESLPAEDKIELAACVSALEAELNEALEDTTQLEEKNSQLTQQLSALREKSVKLDSMEVELSEMVAERKSWDKETRTLRSQLDKAEEMVRALDETVQAVNRQSSCLQSDLEDLEQERDSLKHYVALLKKQLQNVTDKNHVLERALHSSGILNQSKKRYRDELSRLMEQDQQLLRQENERLQTQVQNVHQDLLQSKEKIRQQDTTISSLKQQKQSNSSLLKALEEENVSLEQENVSLKQELGLQKELAKSFALEEGNSELDALRQENEALKAQMAQLSAQLLDSFQAQFVGLLPQSPHRTPRGQQDQDNVQDDRERKLKNMEERMKEVELSLHNVKLLLREKVAQLKEQRHKNGKADMLINDLYVENAQLLKALEITDQRQKIAEKKNYLLEEKISSLNKIVRDLNPSSLSPLPFHYKCSQ